MKFNSQICTSKSQSERLLALGLKKETADMCIRIDLANPIAIPYNEVDEFYYKVVIPAWSLHRLLEIIPQSIKVDDRYFDLEADAYSIVYHYSFVSEDGEGFEDSVGPTNTPLRDNIYDDIIDNIKWLITGGYFNKEYLEE